MSILSSGLKTLRKAAGLPPITLRNALKPAVSQIPVIGPIAGAVLAAKSGTRTATAVALTKTEVERAVDRAAVVVRTGTAVQGVADDAAAAGRNPVVLAAAAAGALYLITRGRR